MLLENSFDPTVIAVLLGWYPGEYWYLVANGLHCSGFHRDMVYSLLCCFFLLLDLNCEAHILMYKYMFVQSSLLIS